MAHRIVATTIIISVLCALLPLMACSDGSEAAQDGAAGGTYSVGGDVVGLAGELELTLNEVETITVTADGAFRFELALPNDSAYSVTVAEQPAGQVCVVANASGAIAGNDVSDVAVTCTAGSSTDLSDLRVSVSEPLSPPFAADQSQYQVGTSPLISEVSVTATVLDPASDLFIDDVLVSSGTPSPPITLNLGNNLVPVRVDASNGDSRTYLITLTRGAELVEQVAYLKASNTDAGDQFGNAIALSGDTLALASDQEDSNATGIGGDQADNTATNSGAVYVFRRSNGVWAQEAYLKASNAEGDDEFGTSIALSGDTLVVGARFESSNATGVNGDQSDNGAARSGAVYVFQRAGSVWSQEAYLKASNTGVQDFFGRSLALSGDTLAVGANFESSNATGVAGNQNDDTAGFSGAVYVFTRMAGAWTQEAYLKASNTGGGDQFGTSIALSGDTLAVGSRFEDSNARGINGEEGDNTADDSGAVYVFRRSGTLWSQEAYLKSSNSDAGDLFGMRVALAGDTLAVGATGEGSNATGINGIEANNGLLNAGAVYIFRRIGVAWSQEAYLKASNTDANDFFGETLALSGNTVAVGAPWESSNATGSGGDEGNDSAIRSGAVYVFIRSDSVWSQEAYIKASNTESEDRFGSSLALSEETLSVGAEGESSNATGINGNQDDNSAAGSGAVYVID